MAGDDGGTLYQHAIAADVGRRSLRGRTAPASAKMADGALRDPADLQNSFRIPPALRRLDDPFASQPQDMAAAGKLNANLKGQARDAPRPAFGLTPEQHVLRRAQMAFARIVSKLAEDFAGWPVDGDDEWDVEALLARSMDSRPLPSCRRSREREALVAVIDISGSCLMVAEFFQRVSALAASHMDVELMSGNNGRIEAVWRPGVSAWQSVRCGRWPFHRRTILFFGDHDGQALVCDASVRNRVTWFSNEVRPGRAARPPMFHGWYLPCGGDADLVRVERRMR
jgi:hypothetical protein